MGHVAGGSAQSAIIVQTVCVRGVAAGTISFEQQAPVDTSCVEVTSKATSRPTSPPDKSRKRHGPCVLA